MTATRFLCSVFLLTGFTLMGVALFYHFSLAHDTGLTVIEPDREMATHPPGRWPDVVFHVHNPTPGPVQVLGFAEC
jgi:hypothetical protein